MNRRTWGYVGIAAALAAIVWQGRPEVTAARQAAGEPVPAPGQAFAYRGAATCASNACHGATYSKTDTERTDAAHRAYTTYMSHGDKHVKAYNDLLTERSKIIARNYSQSTGEKDVAPEKTVLCLRCHSMDPAAVLAGRDVAYADGIGCERCHGAAEKWLNVHFYDTWRALSPAEKEKYGFKPTKDLLTRGQVCAECHVGTGDAQVDHDLYAAGHPRLDFELSSYLATMPPHWSISAEKQRMPDATARTWVIGQVVSAKAALELLETRAKDEKRPWPEFAESDCYACHHDLKANQARQKRGYGDRVPGTLPWNDWYYTMLRGKKGLLGADLGDALDKLAAEMQKPLPDRGEAAKQARAAADMLRDAATAWTNPAKRLDIGELRKWIDAVRTEQVGCTGTWDCDTQRFLALAALHNTLTDLGGGAMDPATRKELEATAKRLRFPHGFDSPRNWLPLLPEDKAPRQ